MYNNTVMQQTGLLVVGLIALVIVSAVYYYWLRRQFELRLGQLEAQNQTLRQTQDKLQEQIARQRYLFDESPLALWEEDFSAVKAHLETLRTAAGSDLGGYLMQHPEEVRACAAMIRVIEVNKASVKLFEAASKADMYQNLGSIFPDEVTPQFCAELAAIAMGSPLYAAETINYTLTGKKIDLYIEWAPLPGHESDMSTVLVSLLDISERKAMERSLRESELRYRSFFEDSPISLWEEDLSALQERFMELRAAGISDFRSYLVEHPEEVFQLVQLIRVLDVNKATLAMYHAGSKEELLGSLGTVFGQRMLEPAREVLVRLAEKQHSPQHESINYTLDGEPRNVLISSTVAPGYEQTHARMILSILDITERKRLQEELQRQATTDVLTGVYNRRHFVELAQKELQRASRTNRPLCLAILDIDHFKQVNDTYGHVAGDQLLMNFAEICQANIRGLDIFARIGGDEFVLLMAETNLTQASEVLERIRRKLEANSVDFCSGSLSISAGGTILQSNQDSLEVLLERADQALYQAKKLGRNRVVFI